MAEQRAQFESELKRRLSLKSSQEEHYLVKAFQYYDLQNTQQATIQQFQQVLEKLGLNLQPLEPLYNYYKSNGIFNYRQFAARIQQSEEIVFYVQKHVKDIFVILSRITQREANYQLLKSVFAELPEDKVRALFSYFEKQNKVNLHDIVTALRGPTQTTLQVDQLTLEELLQKYKGDKNQLRRQAQVYMAYKGINYFTQENFDELNAFINGGKHLWNLDQSVVYTPVKRLDFGVENLTNASKLLSKRGVKAFINLKKLMIHADSDRDGYLSQEQAQRVFRDYKLPLDINGVYIEQFWNELLGPFESRNIAEEIFSSLDSDFDDLILYTDLKQSFQAQRHPDVRKRIRSEAEVLADFLDAFDAHHPQGQKHVTKQEFLDYCAIWSVVLGDEFENVIRNVLIQQQRPLQESRVFQYAPFGTSNDKTDYGTQIRPITAPQKSAGHQYGYYQTNLKSDPIIEKLKSRGIRGFLYLLRQIRQLDAQSIYKAFESVRIPITPEFVKSILGNKTEITHKTFIVKLFGEIQNWRSNLIKQVFRKLQSTNFEDMKKSFIARPRQNLSDEQVLVEFLDTFDQHHRFFNQPQVTEEEFEQYYHIVSSFQTDDRQFEQQLKSGWLV